MSNVLINQKFYPELNQLGIKSTTLDLKNQAFIKQMIETTPAPPVSGMTISDADQVVRWTIDYTLGLAAMPYSILSTVHIPSQVGQVGVGDPVQFGGQAGTIGSNIGPLSSILPTQAAQGLMTSAMISDGLRIGQAPASLMALKSLVTSNSVTAPFKIQTQSLLLNSKLDPVIGLGNTAPTLADNRPDWDKNPQLYIFPAGFPRTDAEQQLSYQTAGLITAFKTRSDKIGYNMTQVVKQRAPSWSLPSSTNINFKDETATSAYLYACDASLKKAQGEGYDIISDNLLSYSAEAGLFLAAAKQYVFCTYDIFIQYWEQQLYGLKNSCISQMNTYFTAQSNAVDDLKTQLAVQDFGQQQAAAAQAQQRQKSTCDKIADVVLIAGIVVVAVVIVLAEALGGPPNHDPYPNTDNYGPLNSNDPNKPKNNQ